MHSEAAQFDFWLGGWEVLAKDRVVGNNRISRIQGGCTFLEEYAAAGGAFEGKSFNYFDLTTVIGTKSGSTTAERVCIWPADSPTARW